MDCQFERLHRSLWHRKHQDDQTEQSPTNKDHSLNGISPYHCPQATHHRVDNDTYRREDDDGMEVPPHQDIHRNSQQVEDRTHTRYLCQQIAGGGIYPSPCTELFLKEGIGRHRASMTIEWNEILSSEVRGDGYGKGKNKGIPVRSKSLARIAYI